MARSSSKPRRDPIAPHGRDANGEPLAPYGLKADGTPRVSRRGAQPGQRGQQPKPATSSAPAAALNAVDQVRVANLSALADMVTMPLIGLSQNPLVRRRIGNDQADALAGDALILTQYAPALAQGVVMAAQSKPGLLHWLDTIEDNAPWLMLAHAGLQVGKALVANHLRPSRRLADAALTMARIRAEQLAAAVEEQARQLGIPTEVTTEDDQDDDDQGAPYDQQNAA